MLLANLDDIDGYRKLIDFANLEEDAGLYDFDGSLVPYPLDESTQIMSAGQWYQLYMTRGKDGTVKLYIRGVCPHGDMCLAFNPILNRIDSEDTQVLSSKGILHFLMNDDAQPGEESGGQIARLRIYDDPLSRKKLEDLKP